MRIIGGTHRGKVLKAPNGLPTRPTTDFAKEGLFNILNNRIDFEGIEVLDLFCGTGNISFEFASRGAKLVTAVDEHGKCIAYIQKEAAALKLDCINTQRGNVFKFLAQTGKPYDLIFADPPYDIPNYLELQNLLVTNNWLKEDGLLLIEHPKKTDFSSAPLFKETRNYGNVNFSFFGR